MDEEPTECTTVSDQPADKQQFLAVCRRSIMTRAIFPADEVDAGRSTAKGDSSAVPNTGGGTRQSRHKFNNNS